MLENMDLQELHASVQEVKRLKIALFEKFSRKSKENLEINEKIKHLNSKYSFLDQSIKEHSMYKNWDVQEKFKILSQINEELTRKHLLHMKQEDQQNIKIIKHQIETAITDLEYNLQTFSTLSKTSESTSSSNSPCSLYKPTPSPNFPLSLPHSLFFLTSFLIISYIILANIFLN